MPSSESPPSFEPNDPLRVGYAGQVAPVPAALDVTGSVSDQSASVSSFVMQAHLGPVPPPSTLAGYAEIDPSFPDRIMAMAEQNAATERLTSQRAQTFRLAEQLVGRVLGAIFAIGALSLAAWLAARGHDWVAGIMAGTTVVAITVALIAGRGDPGAAAE